MSVGAGTPAREELSWPEWCLSSSPSSYWGEGWRRSWGWRWCPGCRWRGRSPRRVPPSHSPALRQHPGSFASGTVLLEANSVPFKRIRWHQSIFRFVFANIRSYGVIQAITWVGFWMLSITWGSRTHAKEGQRYNILTWRLGIFSSWGVCLLWNAKRMGNKMQITSPGLSPSSSTRTGTSQTLSPACHISSNAWQHTRIHKGIIFKSQVTSVCGEGGERTLHSASHSSCRWVDSGTKPILLYLVPIKSSIFLSDSFQTQWVESWALKLQPFYREGFARGSRQLDVPSQRHHWVWHGEDEHNRRQSKSKR